MSRMEYKLKTIVTIVGLLVFAGCVGLVIWGQKSISLNGLGLMMLGVAGIVLCLWIYNRTHR